MKFKTFRLLVGGGVLIVAAGVVALTCSRGNKEETSEKPAAAKTNKTKTPPSEPPTTTAPASASAAGVPPAGSGLPLRAVDQKILAQLPQPIAGDKVKDVFPGETFKVSFYKDAGEAKVNRLKIDLNRNEKWDEKWTIAMVDGKEQIKRQVAPADDEKYTDEYRLVNGTWVRK